MEKTCEGTDESSEKLDFLPGFSDVNVFSQATLQAAFRATKASNAISPTEDASNYNRTFDAFRKFMKLEGKRVLKLMSNVTQHHGGKINYENLEDEDIFEKLIEVNDSILEEAGTALDEAAGLRKKVEDVVLTTVRVTKPIATSWNRKSNQSSPPVYSLLAGKNVQRPQFKFKDKIDNSKGPFIPIIKEKPNSIKPLAVLLEKVDDEEIYSHPYEIEIDKCQPTESHLTVVEPQVPKDTSETPFKLIETEEGLKELVNDLKQVDMFAVDLEHHSYRTFQGITCLMQISTRFCDYVVDVLELRSEVYVLNEVFTDPKILKIFHGANMDVQWLQRDLGIYVVNMFDTGQAASVLQLPHLSLAYLMKHYCHFEPDKQIRLADWRIRPLPPQMLNYARDDTHHLLYIFDCMKKDLVEKGNERKNLLLSVFQKSKEVCLIRYKKPFSTDDGHTNLYIKSKKVFNNRQLYALRELFRWRDSLARVEDESIGYVLPNHMLLQIAEVLPREQQGILACCNPVPPLVRTQLNELHNIVLTARQCPAHKLEAIETVPSTTSSHKEQLVNEESNLNLTCPHDIPVQDSLTKLPTLLNDNLKINEGYNKKFIKKEPSLSIFGLSLTKNAEKDRKEEILTIRKTLNSFVSPFERFKSILAIVLPVDEKTKSGGDDDSRVERLHEHIEELTQSTTSKNSKTQETKDVSKKKEILENSDDDIEVIEPIKNTNASTSKRKRRGKEMDNTVSKNFKPFDYNTVETPNEEGKVPGNAKNNNNRGAKGKKRKAFNPHEEVEYKSDKGSTGKKRRGQKDLSVTYGSNSTRRSARNWPKR